MFRSQKKEKNTHTHSSVTLELIQHPFVMMRINNVIILICFGGYRPKPHYAAPGLIFITCTVCHQSRLLTATTM